MHLKYALKIRRKIRHCRIRIMRSATGWAAAAARDGTTIEAFIAARVDVWRIHRASEGDGLFRASTCAWHAPRGAIERM